MADLLQAARQALEALEELHYSSGTVVAVRMYESATSALRQAIAQAEQPKCSDHSDAPHGFDRNASHNAGRYVCECEGWEPPKAKQPCADFETWWEQEGQEFLYALNTTTDDDIKLVAEIAWKNGAYKAEQQESVALLHIIETDEWPDIRVQVLNGELLQPDMSPVSVYTAPPQLKAEQQEPVAWFDESDLRQLAQGNAAWAHPENQGRMVAVYTAPPQREWVEPSDEQAVKAAFEGFDDYWTEDCAGIEAEAWASSARAVLKLAKELNCG